MGDVKVTDAKTLPTASDNEILVVEPYSGIPTPNNRLANGIYFSFKKIWYNFSKYLVPNNRTITINGDTKDLSRNRDWTVETGAIDSIADTNTVDLNIDVNKELTANVKYQNTSDIDISDDASGLKADLTATGVAAATYGDASNIPQFTVDSKGRITNAVDIPVTIPSVTPSALTRTNDTNVTLTLNGTPATSLLKAVELVVGWTGTLADSRIASAATWNAKEPAITWAQGDLLYGTGTNTYTKLAKNTSATRYLSNTGTSNNPAWAQIDLSNGVTGVLPASNGGSAAWVNYSGTTTVGGFSSITLAQVWYQVNYKSITVYFFIQGTSNATTVTFTLPTAHTSNYTGIYVGSFSRNNGTTLTTPPGISISSSSTTVNVFRDIAQAAWTNSGDKRCGGSFIYQID